MGLSIESVPPLDDGAQKSTRPKEESVKDLDDLLRDADEEALKLEKPEDVATLVGGEVDTRKPSDD